MENLIKNPRVLLKMGNNWSIADIEELNIFLMDVGWDVSGGKSRNVWGNVSVPKELVSYAQEYVKIKNKRPSIWTCYDDSLYSQEGGVWKVTPENLPSTISATFKCSRNRFSPIVENMAMRIAVALDLPTSYNFLVKFTPELHKQITAHINPPGISETMINQYGVVSVDMLKGYNTTKPVISEHIETTEVLNKETGLKEKRETVIPSIDNINGDQLISFFDSERIIGNRRTSVAADDGLVENWMKSIRDFSTSYILDCTEEERNKILSKINSRIARSTLLRTFLGDCDFTALNSGYIYNAQLKKLDYAPNFDYGEAFTSLRVAKLEGLHYSEKDLKFILDHQPNYLEMKKFREAQSIRQIARTYESGTSEENLRFISTHFEDDILEFLTNLNQAVEDNVISEIIYSYAHKNEYGDQLITLEEAQMFDEYIIERANWITFVIIKNIMEAEPEKFVDKIVRDKVGSHARSFSLEKLEGFVDKRFASLPQEKQKEMEAFDDPLKKMDFLKEKFPSEFALYTKNLNTVIDNFWRKPLAPNFIEYFNLTGQTSVLSKDEVKELFIRQFIDKTFTRAFKAENAPLPQRQQNGEAAKQGNKDKA